MRALTTANIINDSLLSQHHPGYLIRSSASSFFIVSADSLALECILFLLYIYQGQNNFCRLCRGGNISVYCLPSGGILLFWLIGETQHMSNVSTDNKTTKNTYIQTYIVLQTSHFEKQNMYSTAIIGSKPFQENHFPGYFRGQFLSHPYEKNPYIHSSLIFCP